jgi:hypothetical protein
MTDTNRNNERTVRCPVDGCGKEVLARGLYLHVLRTSGNGHGPQNEIPDHVDLNNVEEIGTQEVEMNYPDERETEQVARLCPYCERPFTGKQGVLIHLGQVAGRKNHPEDAGERHSEEDFPEVEVDEYGNVTGVVNDTVDSGDVGLDKGDVPRQRVYQLIAELIADGERRTAHRVRKRLLGTDDAIAPQRDEPPHPELYEALLRQGRADQTDYVVNTALEGEKLMVGCRGESAFYTPDEAREVAERIEQVATVEDWRDDRVEEFIKYLRYGADVLDGDRTERSLHEEFDLWK